MLSLNLHRRHLTASQKAIVALECLPWMEEEAKEKQLTGKGEDGSGGRGKKKNLVENLPQGNQEKSRDQAGQMVGVSGRYVSDAKRIKEQAPEVFEQVQKGELTLQQAKQIANLPGYGDVLLLIQPCLQSCLQGHEKFSHIRQGFEGVGWALQRIV